jgi:putative hemolysin
MLFRAHANSLCLSAARGFRPIYFLLSPLVLIVEDVSKIILRWTGGRAFTGRLFGNREEMRAVMQESAPSLTSAEHAMINRVLDLQNFTVRQIATPLAQTVTVEKQLSIGDALKLAREKNFSRLPVWEMREGRRKIAGLLMLAPLLFRDDLDLQKPVAEFLTPALFLDGEMRLEIALRLIQRAGRRMSVVLARDRNEIGIVTLEDILKVMFGEVKL